MDQIILVNASTDLDQLREALKKAHSLRVSIDGDQVKFKINQGMWSHPMGRLDPECEAAQRPKACWCGKHYTGSECDHAVGLESLPQMACCTSQFGQPCAHKREGF